MVALSRASDGREYSGNRLLIERTERCANGLVSLCAETLTDGWLHEAAPLFIRHKEELASFGESELAPDIEMFKSIDAKGMLVLCSARLDRALVGYAVYFVHTMPHYRKEKWAQSDTFWIAPEARRLGLGDMLYDFTEEICRQRGCAAISTSVRGGHVQGRALGMLLRRKGCKLLSKTYAQRL